MKITVEDKMSKIGGGHSRFIVHNVRRILVNLLIPFVVLIGNYFSSLYCSTPNYGLIYIYICLVSVLYGKYYSAFATALSCGFYLYSSQASPVTFESILFIAECIVLAGVANYGQYHLYRCLEDASTDISELEEDACVTPPTTGDDSAVPDRYEMYSTPTAQGFSQLYSLISRLMLQQPERILFETMHVVSELFDTKAVMLYRGKQNNNYLRLVGSLDDVTMSDDSSWDLQSVPPIYESIMNNQLYLGEFENNESFMVLPISCHDGTIIVIVLRGFPFGHDGQYHVTLMETLSLLLRDSLEKAISYEELQRQEFYIVGTDVLNYTAFGDQVSTARDKATEGISDYCVVQCDGDLPFQQMSQKVYEVLRVTDYLGVDIDGNLLVLLNNTGSEGLEALTPRVAEFGISFRLIDSSHAV